VSAESDSSLLMPCGFPGHSPNIDLVDVEYNVFDYTPSAMAAIFTPINATKAQQLTNT
jgi:hypothetical protein